MVVWYPMVDTTIAVRYTKTGRNDLKGKKTGDPHKQKPRRDFKDHCGAI
jgi:hypothetical protein